MLFIRGTNEGLVTVPKGIWSLHPEQNSVFLWNNDFCKESSLKFPHQQKLLLLTAHFAA